MTNEIEVFLIEETDSTDGFYWQQSNGNPTGPFNTYSEALADATESAVCNSTFAL